MGTVWAQCEHCVGILFFRVFIRRRLLLKVQELPSIRRGVSLFLLRPQAFPNCAMAAQFTLAEVDFMQQQAAAGHKPPEVLRRMA